jgi:acyl-coenzyme A thioesterase 13
MASGGVASELATDSQRLAHVRGIHLNRLLPNSPIYHFLLSPIRIVSATRGCVTAQLPITSNHTNSKGGVHGSVSATLVDWVGGLAIASYDMRDNTGVSVDIHISYVGTAKEGDMLEIEGVATKVGGNLAFTEAKIFRLVEGERKSLVATASHTKFVKIP